LKPRNVEGRPAPIEQYLSVVAKSSKATAIADQLAAAWGWRAEPMAAPPAELAEVLAAPGIKVRQAVVKNTQPITPTVAYLGAFSEVLHEDLQACKGPAVVAFTLEPPRPWEVGRLSREFALAEQQGHVPV